LLLLLLSFIVMKTIGITAGAIVGATAGGLFN
jgi:hypothetical protein